MKCDAIATMRAGEAVRKCGNNEADSHVQKDGRDVCSHTQREDGKFTMRENSMRRERLHHSGAPTLRRNATTLLLP
jgi:hypothetical protein